MFVKQGGDGHFTNGRLLVNMDVPPQSSLVMTRDESITDEYVDGLRADLRACVATNNQGCVIIPPMLRKRGEPSPGYPRTEHYSELIFNDE